MYSLSQSKRLLAAFGAGAVCALILPKIFLTLLGATVLLCSVAALSHFSHKEC